MSSMNWDYVAHIIRDVFCETTFTIVYGRNKEMIDVLRTPKHGIGAFMLHTEREKYISNDWCKYWEAGVNDTYFGESICDLFISINYDPKILDNDYENVANVIQKVLKPGGFALLVNPGIWAAAVGGSLLQNTSLENEIKRYSIFKDEDVRVYENI